MKRIVVLTGAGISAESGLKTFRDSDGLWENHAIEQVATFDAWSQNPKMVLDFYNERRKKLNHLNDVDTHRTTLQAHARTRRATSLADPGWSSSGTAASVKRRR